MQGMSKDRVKDAVVEVGLFLFNSFVELLNSYINSSNIFAEFVWTKIISWGES